MSQQSAALVEATVRQQCKALRLPTIGSQFARLAADVSRTQKGNHFQGNRMGPVWEEDLRGGGIKTL
jgi:hypothetical protein